MSKTNRLLIFLFFLTVPLLTSSCDSERNEILLSILRTATLTPTATKVIPTVTQEPTPTLIPTEIPTPTPIPSETDKIRDHIQFGDLDKARSLLLPIYETETHSLESAKAAYLLAQIAFFNNETNKARHYLIQAQQWTESPEVLGPASYLMAQVQHDLENYSEEINAYRKYLEYVPESALSRDILFHIADAYENLNDYEMERNTLEVLLEDSTPEDTEVIRLRIAGTYVNDFNNDEALKIYLDLAQNSTNDSINAAAKYQLGVISLNTGDSIKAFAYLQDIVNTYPKTDSAFSALLLLLDSDQPVSDYQRGLINYYVGQYAKAADAFHRYVKAEPENDGTAWYYIGVCQMYLADYEAAKNAFSTIINDYPSNRFYDSCWDELSYVQWYYQQQYQNAAQTLLDYVALHPDKPDSAKFLYEAGRIYERGKYLSDAAKQWSRVIDEYPLYENSKNALFLSALAYYRSKNYESTIAQLNRLLLVSAIPSDQACYHFWLAKTYEQKKDPYNYMKFMKLAAEDSPAEYYSFRAQEILEGKDLLTLNHDFLNSIQLGQEQDIARQWMYITFDVSEIDLLQAYSYRQDPNYIKGKEYDRLGLYENALYSFDAARKELGTRPLQAFNFMNEMLEMNMYYNAAYAADMVLKAAGLHEKSRTIDVPNYFNHIRYGLWYMEYIQKTAEEFGFSPLLLLAIMRQESYFDPWISSSAGAIGAMQIMPETGYDIAKTLHLGQSFKTQDLNLIPTALRFSGSYLQRMRDFFGGDPFAMLAAYNGGPGNTIQWMEKANNDPDLLAEIIPYEETRNYIYNIYEFAKTYEMLYEK